MSEEAKGAIVLFVVGAVLGIALSWLARSIATMDDNMLRQAIQRRGYDVEALAKETEVDYWKSIATGRVVDPQPVKEEGDGR